MLDELAVDGCETGRRRREQLVRSEKRTRLSNADERGGRSRDACLVEAGVGGEKLAQHVAALVVGFAARSDTHTRTR